jgi:hypothetical protein
VYEISDPRYASSGKLSSFIRRQKQKKRRERERERERKEERKKKEEDSTIFE